MTELLNTTNNPNITNEQKRDAEEKLKICKNEHEKIIEQHTKAQFRHRAFTAQNSIPFGAVSGTVKARLRFRHCTQLI